MFGLIQIQLTILALHYLNIFFRKKYLIKIKNIENLKTKNIFIYKKIRVNMDKLWVDKYRPKKIFGIEPSNAIKIAKKNVGNSSKIKFFNIKGENIEEKEKFDFVFCFGVLYHLKNPYLALENLYKVTNETLIIETQGIKNEKYLNAKIDKVDGNRSLKINNNTDTDMILANMNPLKEMFLYFLK